VGVESRPRRLFPVCKSGPDPRGTQKRLESEDAWHLREVSLVVRPPCISGAFFINFHPERSPSTIFRGSKREAFLPSSCRSVPVVPKSPAWCPCGTIGGGLHKRRVRSKNVWPLKEKELTGHGEFLTLQKSLVGTEDPDSNSFASTPTTRL